MIYSFENFELDIPKQRLCRADEEIRIEPQVFDLLRLLIENHTRLVTKTERISAARSAIGDSGKEQRLIKTVHNRGLRFIGHPVADESPSLSSLRPKIAAAQRPSIIVMPFRARPDNQMELFTADALVDEISALLTSVESLKIIPRYAAGLSLPIDTDPISLAKTLGAQYVVTGHVRREDKRLRVRVILTDLADLRTMWSHKFDGVMEDIFSIEDKICSAVIGALGGKIAHSSALRVARATPENLEAWELTAALDWRPETLVSSVKACRQALEIDPNYPHAHAYLAYFLAWQIAQGWADDPDRNRTDSERHIEIARSLTRHDAEVLSAIGDTYRCLGDPQKAVKFYEECLAQSSDAFLAWPVALPIMGISYAQIGEDAQARACVRAFEDKFPGDEMGRIWSRVALGYIELCAKNYERVNELHANPPSEFNAVCKIIALTATGNRSQAQEEWNELTKANPKISYAHYAAHFSDFPHNKSDGLEFASLLNSLF